MKYAVIKGARDTDIYFIHSCHRHEFEAMISCMKALKLGQVVNSKNVFLIAHVDSRYQLGDYILLDDFKSSKAVVTQSVLGCNFNCA